MFLWCSNVQFRVRFVNLGLGPWMGAQAQRAHPPRAHFSRLRDSQLPKGQLPWCAFVHNVIVVKCYRPNCFFVRVWQVDITTLGREILIKKITGCAACGAACAACGAAAICPRPLQVVTWTVTQSFQLGGHCACRCCWSVYSIRIPRLKFVSLSVPKIWLIFDHGVNWPSDLDLWSFEL